MSNASAAGGSLRRAPAPGARAVHSFTGTQVAWVGTVAPNRGHAEVFVDGVSRGVVDLYAGSPDFRRGPVAGGNTRDRATSPLGAAGRPGESSPVDQKPGETDDIAPAPPRLPDGTQVVLRVTVYDTSGAPVRGATGRVTGDAGRGRYKVTLADGRVLVVGRDQLGVRRADQHATALAGLGPAPGEGSRLVRERTAYAAVVGSRAFGLAGPEPDTDLRGVYVAPAGGFFSLVKPPTHVEGPEHERFSWELERFCELALKANPNVLEVLHSPQVRTRTPVGAELLDLRGAFLSQLAYQTYSGYVLSQFKRIEADLRRDGAPKWKHVMHLLRLLVAARDLLASGRLVLDASAERDRLLAVRAGQMRWAEIGAWRRALHAEVDEAFARTPLPPGPDAPRVDAWLRSVRGRDIRGELDLRLLPETP